MTALVSVPVMDGQLAIPTTVWIPKDPESARQQLAAIDGLATASEWARAAIVATFVEVGQPPGPRPDGSEVSHLTPKEFAALGLAGLKSDNTVRRYALAWGARPRPTPETHKDLPQEEFPASPGAHVSNNSGENEWYTPPPLIEAARACMGGIDLDPATSEVAQATVLAARYYTADDDGLAHPWVGNVWLNPPYAQPLIGEFIAKLVSEFQAGNVARAVVLVNNATETAWGQTLLGASTAVCFHTGRVRFIDPDGNPGGAPLQGQMLAYLDAEGKRDPFDSEFARFGVVL